MQKTIREFIVAYADFSRDIKQYVLKGLADQTRSAKLNNYLLKRTGK
ncbi:MAG TPA: hypothetical protein PKN87_05920 [Syntrophomonadaceae bacterium]|nr:hypothetical protein [Syntrophomonadaceae bacterium]HNX28933.1 hypothetical protein [Syntrophomonadaceae bacterium]HPR93919.1 hypothetical protein [Syntrophomonadaceae bacterium]